LASFVAQSKPKTLKIQALRIFDRAMAWRPAVNEDPFMAPFVVHSTKRFQDVIGQVLTLSLCQL
jgi:hypothetical protein